MREGAHEREADRHTEDHEQLAASGHGRTDESRDAYGDRERADDREPAKVRHRIFVALVRTRMVEHVPPEREAQDERGEEQRERAGHEENREVLPTSPGHDDRQYRQSLPI